MARIQEESRGLKSKGAHYPPFSGLDFALLKDFSLTGKYKLRFRAVTASDRSAN
jgi:hypothetical protein